VPPVGSSRRRRHPGIDSSGGAQGFADELGLAVKLIATWRRGLPRRSVDLEPVARKAGDDVQVRMQDFLAGGFAIGDEEIDAIRADAVAVAKGVRELAGHSE
jgi:hypothetical protein